MRIPASMLGRALERALLAAVTKVVTSDRVLLAGATSGATVIKVRTAKGIDKDGKRFPPYSPKYAARRKRKGRPVDRVTLSMSAGTGMMGDLVATAEDGKGIIEFKSGRVPASGEIAAYHVEGEAPLPKRDLAGIDGRPEDVKKIQGALERAMRQELRSEGP